MFDRDHEDPFADIAEPQPLDLLEIESQSAMLAEESFVVDLLHDVLEPEDFRRPVGRLGATGDDDAPVDFDDEADAVAWSGDADDMSAEEAAVHITYDPQLRESDGYPR